MTPAATGVRRKVERIVTDILSKLPLFATDDEIAIAIVGKARASNWKRGALPILEARGLPRVDPLHGGRPVPLVRKFYDNYLGVHRSYIVCGVLTPPTGSHSDR